MGSRDGDTLTQGDTERTLGEGHTGVVLLIDGGAPGLGLIDGERQADWPLHGKPRLIEEAPLHSPGFGRERSPEPEREKAEEKEAEKIEIHSRAHEVTSEEVGCTKTRLFQVCVMIS